MGPHDGRNAALVLERRLEAAWWLAPDGRACLEWNGRLALARRPASEADREALRSAMALPPPRPGCARGRPEVTDRGLELLWRAIDVEAG